MRNMTKAEKMMAMSMLTELVRRAEVATDAARPEAIRRATDGLFAASIMLTGHAGLTDLNKRLDAVRAAAPVAA